MTDRVEPQTLAEVAKGDTVTLFLFGFSPHQETVRQVTTHLIILSDKTKYDRRYGSSKVPGTRSYIRVGKEASDRIREIGFQQLKTQVAATMNVPASHLNQETVTTHRAACDRAEAALRELGEWKDET
jgi:hypothetical protein